VSAGKVILALDGMGGDRAPDVVVNGAAIARERYPGTTFLLFGDPATLKPLVDSTAKSVVPMFDRLVVVKAATCCDVSAPVWSVVSKPI